MGANVEVPALVSFTVIRIWMFKRLTELVMGEVIGAGKKND